MAIRKITNTEYFRGNLIMYWALILGVIMANVVIVFMFMNEAAANMFTKIDFPIVITAFALMIICIFLSRSVFKKRLELIQSKPVLAEKMSSYRVALVIKFAFLEFPAFICIFLFAFSNEVVIMGVVLVILGYYLSEKPSRQKCYSDLCLNDNEKMMLDDPDAKICEITV